MPEPEKIDYPSRYDLRQLGLPYSEPIAEPGVTLRACYACTSWWAVSENADNAFVCPECEEYHRNLCQERPDES